MVYDHCGMALVSEVSEVSENPLSIIYARARTLFV
jgi:hypothetical protein